MAWTSTISNNLYVANADSILVFAPNASGSAQPIRTIKGPHTGLTNCVSIAVDPTGIVYAGNYFPQNEDGHITVYAPSANGDAQPFHTITGDLKFGFLGMAINKPKVFVPSLETMRKEPALIASLFGGVAVDGGGFIFIAGVPIPVPVGPLRGDVSLAMSARRDILIGLAIEQIASGLSDRNGHSRVRKVILDLVKTKVDELLTRLPD